MLISAGDMCSAVDTRRYEVTHLFTICSSSLTETMVDISMNMSIVQLDALHGYQPLATRRTELPQRGLHFGMPGKTQPLGWRGGN